MLVLGSVGEKLGAACEQTAVGRPISRVILILLGRGQRAHELCSGVILVVTLGIFMELRGLFRGACDNEPVLVVVISLAPEELPFLTKTLNIAPEYRFVVRLFLFFGHGPLYRR